jgi:hypothetical protein
MRAMDIMTTNVITITPDASVQNPAAEHVSSVESLLRSSAFRPRERGDLS